MSNVHILTKETSNTVTDIEKGRGVNWFTVFVVLDGVARFSVDARDWVFCIEKGQV